MSRGAALNAVKSAATQTRLTGGEMRGRQKDDFYPTPPYENARAERFRKYELVEVPAPEEEADR